MVDKQAMWETIQGDPNYAEKVKRVAELAGVSYEETALVLEAYYDVGIEMSKERIAARVALEVLEDSKQTPIKIKPRPGGTVPTI